MCGPRLCTVSSKVTIEFSLTNIGPLLPGAALPKLVHHTTQRGIGPLVLTVATTLI